MTAAAKPARQYHHGGLRDALLEAALDVVSKRGVEDLRLRDLARRLGVNHRAAYRHFEDRDALVVEVAIQGWVRLGERLEQARAEADAPVRAMLRAYVRFALTRGGHYRCMLGRGAAGPGQSPALRRATLATIRIVEAEIVEQTGDSLERVRDRVFALWGLAHGLCDLVLCRAARVASVRRAEAWIVGLCGPLLEDGGLS